MSAYYVMLTDDLDPFVPPNLINMMLTESPLDPMSCGDYPWKNSLAYYDEALKIPSELWWIGPLRKVRFGAVAEWRGLIVSQNALDVLAFLEGSRMVTARLRCTRKSGAIITNAPYHYARFATVTDLLDRDRSDFAASGDGQIESVRRFVPKDAPAGAHVFCDRSLPPQLLMCTSEVRDAFTRQGIGGIHFLDISLFDTDRYSAGRL